MCESVFSPAKKDDLPFILDICRDKRELADVYTALKISSPDIYIGCLWCGRQENKIREIIYDNGSFTLHYNIEKCSGRFYKSENDGLFNENKTELCFMEYTGTFAEVKAEVMRLHGKKTADVYLLCNSENSLSETSEKRYIYNVLCDNKGLSAVFALYEGEKIISTASIVSTNEKYALIGNVFTEENYRNFGYASILVNSAVNYALEKGLVPTLVCEKKLVGFYEKLGFERR